MLLKTNNTTRSIFKNNLSFIKQNKVLVGVSLFIIYTLLAISLGYILHRHDFYGHILKPALSTNFRMIGAYFESFSVNPEKIIIDIKHKDYLKLAYKRQEALKINLLQYLEEDWVPATISHDGKRIKADIRLKGTMPAHWKDENVWSLKVKIKGTDTLFGMKRFALNKPSTRTFMNEWYWQRLLRYSGLISLRYDFVDVTINGRNLPIYAIEENFEKRLIENNSLREGPIFRARLRYPFSSFYNQALLKPHSRAISVYQYGKYSKNPEFMKLVNLAESRVESYRQGDLIFSKVFDVKKMGKLIALTDLVQSRHSIGMENLRFYYNPVTGLIEPIAYDGTIPLSRIPQFEFSGNGRQFIEKENRDSGGYSAYDRWGKYSSYQWPMEMFRDKELFKKYIESLEEISEKSFLDQFFKSMQDEAEEKEKTLHRSFPYYEFDKAKFYKNGKYIKEQLQPSKSLNVYYEGKSKENEILYLDLANIIQFPVEILGVSLDGGNIMQPLQKTIIQAKKAKFGNNYILDQILVFPGLDSMKRDLLKEIKSLTNLLPMVSVNNANTNQKLTSKESSGLEYKRVNFRIPRELKWSDDLTHRLQVISRVFGARFKTFNKIIPWARHEDMFLQPSNIKETPFMLVDEEKKMIRIKPGEWAVEQDVVIPSGYRVTAREGTRLRLTHGVKILSYSAVEFIGSKEQPIIISSEDKSGQGMVVMEAKNKSIIQHTIFDGLSNPMRGGWALTGAVTFYESPVELSNVQFSDMQSEDGLNIIRSKFLLESVAFRGMRSDAFDADFSNGVIKDASFLNCGNDALDVSGSEIHVGNIFLNSIGDKGISVGEKSQVFIDKLDGKNSRILVASKDQSEVFIKLAKLENSQVGFTAFQKKDEFGPGIIEVKTLESKNIETLFLIEEGSSLKIGGNAITARVKDVEKTLYGG